MKPERISEHVSGRIVFLARALSLSLSLSISLSLSLLPCLLSPPIGSVSSLKEKQLFPPPQRTPRGTVTLMSALADGRRTSLRVGGTPPRYGIPKTPQIRAEVISRLRGVKVEGGWPALSLQAFSLGS